MHSHAINNTSALERITLDLSLLVEQQRLSLDEALHLKTLATTSPRKTLLANLALIFGAILIVAGILATHPDPNFGFVLAILSLGAGTALHLKAKHEWFLFGRSLIWMGVLGISAYLLLQLGELATNPVPTLAWSIVAALTTIAAITYKDALFAALAPIALGSAIGSGTLYDHAAYILFVQEPSITIILFTTLFATLTALRTRIPQGHELIATIAARTSFILANLGFWVGSLWGDFPGEIWRSAKHATPQAFYISPDLFSLIWVLALVSAIIMGIRTGRRFISTTSVVFLAIHFYTQLFERFLFQPEAMVASGFALIAMGTGIAGFDRWLRNRIQQG